VGAVLGAGVVLVVAEDKRRDSDDDPRTNENVPVAEGRNHLLQRDHNTAEVLDNDAS